MYKSAYKYSHDVVFYFDAAGNKYVASGGSLAWRINNPGLVRSRQIGSIGNFGRYAIFSSPHEGRVALEKALRSKKNASMKSVAKHYQSSDLAAFIGQLSPDATIKSLSKHEFDYLLHSIEKFCGYTQTGSGSFLLLPKIIAKIESGKEDAYLIGDHIILSKKEAIEWIQSHRLDGVIVHEKSGAIHLRSRPNHCIWNIKMRETILPPSKGKPDPLARVVGEKKPGQCIWGFINGIRYSKDEALEAASCISSAAKGEAVWSMPNDTALLGVKNGAICLLLKMTIDTPIVAWAAKFFRYLLNLSKQDNKSPPVVVFVHSQGAIISEHALELLNKDERKKIRIFTFGGGSFIVPGKSHPESHNYASAADFVCSMGSPHLQSLALQRYYGLKKGLTIKQIIDQLAYQDTLINLDSIDPKLIAIHTKQRVKHYENEFLKIDNITVLDPDSDRHWKHQFTSRCYQTTIHALVKKHQQMNDDTK